MILEVHSETPRSIENLRSDDIEQVVRSIDWYAPDSLTLSLDDENWLNVERFPPEDGFCINYHRNKVTHHFCIDFSSDISPDTLAVITRALVAFSNADMNALFAIFNNILKRDNDALFLGQDYESYIGRMKEFEFMLDPEQLNKLQLAINRSKK